MVNLFINTEDADLALIMDTIAGFYLEDLENFSEQLFSCTPPEDY